MSRRFRVVLASSFAVLAVVLCLAYGERVRSEERRQRQESLERYGGEVVSVVVASKTLEPGEVLGSGNIEARDWVSDLVPEGALTTMDAARGRKVTGPVAAGQPLCELNFRQDGDSLETPPGMLALSIPVTDRLGIPSDVRAGDKLVALRVTEGKAALLTESIVVLSAPAQSQSLAMDRTMSVAVSPEDLSAVLTSSNEGSLRLAEPAEGLVIKGGAAQAAPTKVEAKPEGSAKSAEAAKSEKGDGAAAKSGDAAGGAEK